MWQRKPALREVYRGFHQLLAGYFTRTVAGASLELGSGIGAIKEVVPDCVTSDIFANPWLDRQENAYGLSYSDGSVANLVLFDVWHHLQYPGTALAEFARVLAPGGRVLIFDPDMSLVGRILYGLFHHEPVGWSRALTWKAPPDVDLARPPYFAAQASAHRIFIRREETAWQQDWTLVACRRLASFTYAATGGFRGPQLYPSSLVRALRSADRFLSLLPGIFSNRILVVLERKPGQGPS